MKEGITIKTFSGKEIEPYIKPLSKLRVEIFREYPYLYKGSEEYEIEYTKPYLKSDQAAFVVAFDGNHIIGISTCIPLPHETKSMYQPFKSIGYNINKIMYFGESVLKKDYRGQGIGKAFFQKREEYTHSLGDYQYAAFCTVERSENHYLKPQTYNSPEPLWRKMGYEKMPQIKTKISWQDRDESRETPKTMVFWLKKLSNSQS